MWSAHCAAKFGGRSSGINSLVQTYCLSRSFWELKSCWEDHFGVKNKWTVFGAIHARIVGNSLFINGFKYEMEGSPDCRKWWTNQRGPQGPNPLNFPCCFQMESFSLDMYSHSSGGEKATGIYSYIVCDAKLPLRNFLRRHFS